MDGKKIVGPAGVTMSWSRGEDGLTENQRVVLAAYKQAFEKLGRSPYIGEVVNCLPPDISKNPYSLAQGALRGLAKRGLAELRQSYPRQFAASRGSTKSDATNDALQVLIAKREEHLDAARKLDLAIAALRGAL